MDKEKYQYVGIDLETTGFSPKSDEIIEISAIEFDINGNIGEHFHQLCYPVSGHVPAGATKVNNITIGMLEGKPNYFKDGVREKLAEFIGKRTLVGHNVINFDSKFLKIEINSMEDTLKMCRNKYAGGNKLSMACKRIGISWIDEEAHRSEYDTLKCIELFCKMKSMEKPKKSIENLDLFKNLPGVVSSKSNTIGVIPSESDKRMFSTQAYSYSRISLFLQCPFKWYMRYIKKHHEPDVDYLITGKICHTIAEWSGDWCSRQLFINKLSAYIEQKNLNVPIRIGEDHIGAWLYRNPSDVKKYFPNFMGRASLIREIDNVISQDSYENPSMPDWETYVSLMEEAFRRHNCTDVEIMEDVKKIMTRFFDKSDFSLCTGEVTITEKRLAFNKNWELLKDFYANDVFFRAILDVINFFGDRVVIRDYKSSRSMIKESQLLNDPQMRVYLLVIYNFLPRGSYDKITLEIDYIRFGKQISVDVDARQIEEVAGRALDWINSSIQKIEKEMAKTDGTAFQPTRNEYCYNCHLASEGICPLFDKRVINSIDNPETFVISDVNDCQTAWKRIEANKLENKRLLNLCKKFIKNSDVKVTIDEKAVLDFYVEQKRNYNAESVIKELLSREVDIKYIIKFLTISKSSFESLCEKQGIVFSEEELNSISSLSTESSFTSLTEEEISEKSYLNS